MQDTIDIVECKESLNHFIDKLKTVNEDSYNLTSRTEIYSLYKELYAKYIGLTPEVINNSFTPIEVKTIHILEMGNNEEEKFNDLIKALKSNSQETIFAVTDFIKKREGFDFINSNANFENFSDEEIVSIFGSLFGVKVATECVTSLRKEKIGSVIGYALSGLCEEHLEEYRTSNSKKDIVTFLKNKINSSDVTVNYNYSERPDRIKIDCVINESLGIDDCTTRKKNKIDHCFINHKTKTIVFGLNTSDEDVEKQKFNFYQIHQILNKVVNSETINDHKNKYHGYKLESYYLMGGRFVADNKDLKQEIGRAFLKMFPKISPQDKQLLAQLPYYRLYANSPSEHATSIIPSFNTFIAGCDTLNIHQWQEKHKFNPNPVAHLSHVVGVLTKTTELINNSKFSLDESGKQLALLYIKDIKDIGLSLGRGFKLELDQSQYETIIQPFYNGLESLVKKLEGNEYGSVVIDELVVFKKNFKSVDKYNEFVEESHSSKLKNIEFEYLPKEDKKIQIDDQYLNKVADIASNLARHTTNGFGYLNNFAYILRCMGNGEELESAKLKCYSTLQSFSTSKQAALRSSTNNLIKEFIEASGFLVKQAITKPYYDKEVVKLNEFINERLLVNDEALLHELSKKSKSSLTM